MTASRKRALRVLAVGAALAVWSLAATLDLASDRALPGSVETLVRLAQLVTEADTWSAIGRTLSVWGTGLVFSGLIATPIGILLGSSRFSYRSSRFVVDFLRTIPALGLIPLAALVFGATRSAVLVIVVPACVWPLLLQTTYGVRDADPLALDIARSYRLGRVRTLRRVVLPGALPFIGTGLRLAAISGLLLAVSVELLILVPGVGSLIAVAQRNGETVDVYAFVLLSGFLGLAVTMLFSRLERWMIRWHPSVRTAA